MYFGTSFSSLSYVDCESRGRNTSGQYLRSSNVRAFASGHNGARRDDHSLVRRSLARLSAHPLGLAPSPTAFSMVRPTRRATKFTHLFEEHLVVGLLLHLPLGPFLRAREKPRVGVVDVSHRAHPPKRIRALGSSETSPLETRSRPSLASIDRTHARERIHSDRSPSRPPRVLLASSSRTAHTDTVRSRLR